MSTENEVKKVVTTKSFFEQENVKLRFQEMFKNEKKATAFIASVLQIASSNELLSKADPASIYQSAMVAATLNLPLNANLGFAYIVPYNDRKSGKQIAQFQMGYKGFIQLAQRSGQFHKISSAAIYEGQIVSENPLTGYEFDFSKKTSNTIVGYAAYFRLINGYESTLYMTKAELTQHGTKYSQTFKKGFGLWSTDFDAMASKTVLKLLLSKYAPLSTEMETAVQSDQSIIVDAENGQYQYVDNTKETAEEVSAINERNRILNFIESSINSKDLITGIGNIELDAELQKIYDAKINLLTENESK